MARAPSNIKKTADQALQHESEAETTRSGFRKCRSCLIPHGHRGPPTIHLGSGPMEEPVKCADAGAKMRYDEDRRSIEPPISVASVNPGTTPS